MQTFQTQSVHNWQASCCEYSAEYGCIGFWMIMVDGSRKPEPETFFFLFGTRDKQHITWQWIRAVKDSIREVGNKLPLALHSFLSVRIKATLRFKMVKAQCLLLKDGHSIVNKGILSTDICFKNSQDFAKVMLWLPSVLW